MADEDEPISARTGSSMSAANNNYHYPFAAAPDIIRSHQKDAYFQSVLLEQLSTILRNLYGARFIHHHAPEARTVSDLLYLCLTTLIGNRTLGEEYTDVVQVEDDTLRLPSLQRRAGYIASSILLPYSLSRILPSFRRRLRAKLERNLQPDSSKTPPRHPQWKHRLQTYLLTNLDVLTSPSPLYALSLTAFYFSGAYYHLSKRLAGLRYIFTKRLEPSEQRVGYEVLGVLLVLQMAVQGWLHMHQTLSHTDTNTDTSPPADISSATFTAAAAAATADGGTAMLDNGIEIPTTTTLLPASSASPSNPPTTTTTTSLSHTLHTPHPPPNQPHHTLAHPHTMRFIRGRPQRTCTLCLEPIKDPSATTCGHLFCWTCIVQWCREKPECPLCRQVCWPQHVLPLRP
ncbi:MAG: hypothetical protein M1819_004421 [Sarea resinae]|nr:MAG: hypothetical protein M1819_004421 [Sarea resinae]